MKQIQNKSLSLTTLIELKLEFDKVHSTDYFSIIAPDSFEEFCQISNFNYYIANKVEFPTYILSGHDNLNLWIIENSKIPNVYKSKLWGFIKYSDFIHQKK